MTTSTTLKRTSFLRNAFFIASILFCTSLFAQEAVTEDQGILEFENMVLDYGTIAHNADGVRAFKFKNVGTAPVVITNVKGSCGCTVPTKPNGPIMPGETAEIGVKYATNRVGAFSKTVTVTSNASEPSVRLRIKGNVLPEATPSDTTSETSGK
ncbi:hypothetical protein SCB49_14520 [unidentified eubacterium SCB49]|nr:hypothetical protein SCB49_14520 [unidentified eubacterium SCB49]